MHALFRGISVLPVLTIERERDAVPLARALLIGGLALDHQAADRAAAVAEQRQFKTGPSKSALFQS